MYFDKILVANRGEIAVRVIRACRELGIATVAVYSEADRGALHVRLADEAILVGPPPAAQSYLNVAAIVEAARRSGAQAVHPGYGFLSERAHFAQACRDAGIVFVGPPPEAIETMGSKIAAKRLAESVGVPTAPGYMGDDQRPERLREEAARVGFPLLIKASAGGGGKGMRTVSGLHELDAALEGAKREALAAFGDDSVFLEKLILRPRHVEIQILADGHGGCVHLFERECSIQRRHQKIVEEAPSPALAPELRAEMGAAAVRLAQAAGYVGAGTVEFVAEELEEARPASPGARRLRPYFLEMNTRLQVEHPVTEAVTGVDLVRLQIAIAAGAPLPFRQEDLAQRGHAIEVRVYAEDPTTFLPSIGQVALFAPPEGPGVRNDAGLESGDEVTLHYDPMVAKLVVAAPDRAAAVERLRRALDDYAVLGVTTNLPLLRAIAAHPAFHAAETFTDFLSANQLEVAEEPAVAPPEVLAAAALFDHRQPAAHPRLPTADPWSDGVWRHLRAALRMRYTLDGEEQEVVLTQVGDRWRAAVGERALEAEVITRRPDLLVIAIADGEKAAGAGARSSSTAHPRSSIERFRIVAREGELLLAWRGASYRLRRVRGLSVESLGGSAGGKGGHAGLDAPMPGTVIKVLVAEGDPVEEHQPLVVLEAMKMEHIVAAPHDGVVRRLFFQAGALVAKGATLVELDEA